MSYEFDYIDELPEKDMPREKDLVWVDGQEPQPNGYVVMVNREDELVMVRFHDDQGSWAWFDLDLFRGNFHPEIGREHGGTWMPLVNF